MHQSRKNNEQQSAAKNGSQQDPELSEAWRALLGSQAAENKPRPPQADLTDQVLPLAGDPWSHLAHVQGMQAVDLQTVRLYARSPRTENDDIECALDIMQEAAGPPVSLEKPASEM